MTTIEGELQRGHSGGIPVERVLTDIYAQVLGVGRWASTIRFSTWAGFPVGDAGDRRHQRRPQRGSAGGCAVRRADGSSTGVAHRGQFGAAQTLAGRATASGGAAVLRPADSVGARNSPKSWLDTRLRDSPTPERSGTARVLQYPAQLQYPTLLSLSAILPALPRVKTSRSRRTRVLVAALSCIALLVAGGLPQPLPDPITALSGSGLEHSPATARVPTSR